MRVILIDPSNFTLPYDAGLARGLAEAGHEVAVIGRAATGEEAWGERTVPFHPAFYRGLGDCARLPRSLFLGLKGISHAGSWIGLRSLLDRLRPDAIHVQWFPIPLIDRMALRILRRRAPVVLTMHDTEPFNGAPSAAVQRIGALGIARACDRVIVHTALGARRLAGNGIERVSIVPHGPLGSPKPASTPPDGPPEILLIGKMKPYKGVDVLIEAVGRMPEEVRRKARVSIAGKPYFDIEPLQQRVRAMNLEGVVTFDLRFMSDAEMEERMRRASILVFPYREIEASGVLAQALGHGRAIVASAVGGFVETLRDGVTARLVPPEDPTALAAALTELVEETGRRCALGAAAAQLAAVQPSWSRIAAMTAGVYAAAQARR